MCAEPEFLVSLCDGVGQSSGFFFSGVWSVLGVFVGTANRCLS